MSVLTDDDRCCAVTELRRYTLVPGSREALIDLFEQHFLDGQQSVGIHVVATFVDLDDPDRFIWLRGFRDMEQRRRALAAFYYGDLWRQHRDAANATMVDSDDVLLLAPVSADLRPGHSEESQTEPGEEAAYVVAIHPGGIPPAEPAPVGVLATLAAENTFPALPVREDFTGHVTVTRHEDVAAARTAAAAIGDGASAIHVCRPTGRSGLR